MLGLKETKRYQLKSSCGTGYEQKKELHSSETGEKEVIVKANVTLSVLRKTKMKKSIIDRLDFQQEK